MRKSLNKEKVGNILFFLGITIELIIMLFNFSAFDLPYAGRLHHLAFMLFGIKVLLTKYSKKEWITIVGIAILGSISYFATGDERVLLIAMLVLSSKNVENRRVISYIFYIILIGSIIIIVLSLFGVGGLIVDIRDYGRGGEEARWCLGFGHANHLHGTMWYLVSLGLFLYYKKAKGYHFAILTVLNIGLYLLTISRTGLIATQIVIFAAIIFKYTKRIEKQSWIYWCGVAAICACMVITLISVIVLATDYPILSKLNRLLSGRMEFAYYHADISNWRFISSGGPKNLVDNGWAVMFCAYGWVIGIFYIAINLLMIRRFYLSNQGMKLTLLLTCAMYTFMESTYVMNEYLPCNFVYLLLIGTWTSLLGKDMLVKKPEDAGNSCER